jgi:hypothetical protein
MADPKVALEDLREKVHRAFSVMSREFDAALAESGESLDIYAKEREESASGAEEARVRLKAIEDQCQERLRRQERQLREKLDAAEVVLTAKHEEISRKCREMDEASANRLHALKEVEEAKGKEVRRLDGEIAAKEKHLAAVMGRIESTKREILNLMGAKSEPDSPSVAG